MPTDEAEAAYAAGVQRVKTEHGVSVELWDAMESVWADRAKNMPVDSLESSTRRALIEEV